MATEKRLVEVVTVAYPLCEDTVRLVTSLPSSSCEVQAYDFRDGCAPNQGREKAAR